MSPPSKQGTNTYRIGRGETGVFSGTPEPYKSAIQPLWAFRTLPVSLASAQGIYALFLGYEQSMDFIGMDSARKFLQMGMTRSARYANHASGRKYAPSPSPSLSSSPHRDNKNRTILPQQDQTSPAARDKRASSEVFRHYWNLARQSAVYVSVKDDFLAAQRAEDRRGKRKRAGLAVGGEGGGSSEGGEGNEGSKANRSRKK